METHSELLTARFYEWEQLGRGWHVFDEYIDIEPPFTPFLGHYLPEASAVDDTKKPSWLSRFGQMFRREDRLPIALDMGMWFVNPYLYGKDATFVAFSVCFPKEAKIEFGDMDELLLMLSDTEYPISFEIHGSEDEIRIQFVCRTPDTSQVLRQLAAYYPDLLFTERTATLESEIAGDNACVVDFGLTEEFMRPLRMLERSDNDPYIGLFAALEDIRKGERVTVQVLFKGTQYPWSESILRAVSDNDGGCFFTNAPEMIKQAKEKVSAPLFAVCVRVMAFAATTEEAISIVDRTATSLMRITASGCNSLSPLSSEGHTTEAYFQDACLRKSHRLGMLLNARELATMVHIPSDKITSLKFERQTLKTKTAPQIAIGHKLVIGVNTHNGMPQEVSLPSALRLKHAHIIGATGTGKSTLLLSMIAQDMAHGNGCAVLDPHGDLIESILPYVPQERIQDVIVVDPSDGEYPVAFNILSAHSAVEKDILSSDLVAAFKRLSTSWGDQMNSVFANAILAFLESPEGGTLADVRRFLIEKPFRDKYLKTVADPHIVYYWQHEYPLLKSSSLGSILTRLDTFLRPKLIRNMVAQKKGLDFEHILDSKKILLVKLSQGLMGAENSYLLGTFFVSKMYQAAMARQAKNKAERSDFFMYIDEFQNFITPSMSYILSGARKYHLGLILAHQDMQQLQRYDSELASSVVVNAGTRVCFRLGDTDAKRFASGFSYFDASDLENLRTGEAIARIEQPSMDFNLSTLPLEEVDATISQEIIQAVIQHSRSAYGTPVHLVEQSLAEMQPPHQEQEKEQQPIQRPEPVIEPPPIRQEALPTQDPVVVHKRVSKVVTQHRYLQTLIKKMAQARGYKATIEQLTPDGNGRVDVSLEKNGKRIACEISVTTDDAWEIHNVEKCLAAGYDIVIVCSNDAKNLQRIKQQIERTLDPILQAKVLSFEAQQAIQYFDEQAAKDHNEEKVIKGYRVKVNYSSSTEEETKEKQEQIAKMVSKSKKKKP